MSTDLCRVEESEEQIDISTSALQAEVRKRGYVSGVAAGSEVSEAGWKTTLSMQHKSER